MLTSLQKDMDNYSIKPGEKEDVIDMKTIVTNTNSFKEAG